MITFERFRRDGKPSTDAGEKKSQNVSREFGDTSRFPEPDGEGGYTPSTIAFSLSREYDGP